MLWFEIVLVAVLIRSLSATEDAKEKEDKKKVPWKAATKDVEDVYPYKLEDKAEWKTIRMETGDSGYPVMYPTYVTVYDSVIHDILMYIYPPHACDAVWMCFYSKINETEEKDLYDITMEKLCDESLRFSPLEQMVYVKKNATDPKAYPYFSNMVEITYSASSKGKEYTFHAFKDFDGHNIKNVERSEKIELNMAEAKIVVMTSNAYCHAKVMQPFKGVVSGRMWRYWANDTLEGFFRYKSGSVQTAGGPNTYVSTGSLKGSASRQGMYKLHESTIFDDPKKRMNLETANIDCCPLTWEFEGFIQPGDWIREHRVTYLQYKLVKNTVKKECGTVNYTEGDKNTRKMYRPTLMYQSVLLEVGVDCEWVRICFDTDKNVCYDDVNTLSFIFVHNVYIPTDADEARPIGLPFEEQDPFRINFIQGEKGIELGYAFVDHVTPGITDLMQLEVYDGMDPSKLTLNLVRAPNCDARLLNDLGSANLRSGTETTLQCLSIKSCRCLEGK